MIYFLENLSSHEYWFIVKDKIFSLRIISNKLYCHIYHKWTLVKSIFILEKFSKEYLHDSRLGSAAEQFAYVDCDISQAHKCLKSSPNFPLKRKFQLQYYEIAKKQYVLYMYTSWFRCAAAMWSLNIYKLTMNDWMTKCGWIFASSVIVCSEWLLYWFSEQVTSSIVSLLNWHRNFTMLSSYCDASNDSAR